MSWESQAREAEAEVKRKAEAGVHDTDDEDPMGHNEHTQAQQGPNNANTMASQDDAQHSG